MVVMTCQRQKQGDALSEALERSGSSESHTHSQGPLPCFCRYCKIMYRVYLRMSPFKNRERVGGGGCFTGGGAGTRLRTSPSEVILE